MATNWNPSPPNSPPETDNSTNLLSYQLPTASYGDRIQDTVFSKSWILSVLVKAVNVVQDIRDSVHVSMEM